MPRFVSIAVGRYRTEHGSDVHVLTRNAGSWIADFDWFEEPNACCDCRVVDVDPRDCVLMWECDICGGGMAELTRVKD